MTAPVVVRIFQLFVDGYGYLAIAERLTAQHLWISSAEPTHQALVSRETFDQVQARIAARSPTSPRAAATSPRPYALRGRLSCGPCQRCLQGQWVRGEAYYRCRYPASTPKALALTIRSTSTSARPTCSRSWTRGSPGWSARPTLRRPATGWLPPPRTRHWRQRGAAGRPAGPGRLPARPLNSNAAPSTPSTAPGRQRQPAVGGRPGHCAGTTEGTGRPDRWARPGRPQAARRVPPGDGDQWPVQAGQPDRADHGRTRHA